MNLAQYSRKPETEDFVHVDPQHMDTLLSQKSLSRASIAGRPEEKNISKVQSVYTFSIKIWINRRCSSCWWIVVVYVCRFVYDFHLFTMKERRQRIGTGVQLFLHTGFGHNVFIVQGLGRGSNVFSRMFVRGATIIYVAKMDWEHSLKHLFFYQNDQISKYMENSLNDVFFLLFHYLLKYKIEEMTKIASVRCRMTSKRLQKHWWIHHSYRNIDPE